MLFSNVRALIVDDFAPWRRFVVLALSVIPGIEIVGEAENGLTAIQKMAELQPDIAILDIGLPDIAGIEVAQRGKSLSPQTKVVFLTDHCSQDIVKGALDTGAFGYVVKSRAAHDLIPAVLAVLAEEHFISVQATEALLTESRSFRRPGRAH